MAVIHQGPGFAFRVRSGIFRQTSQTPVKRTIGPWAPASVDQTCLTRFISVGMASTAKATARGQCATQGRRSKLSRTGSVSATTLGLGHHGPDHPGAVAFQLAGEHPNV